MSIYSEVMEPLLLTHKVLRITVVDTDWQVSTKVKFKCFSVALCFALHLDNESGFKQSQNKELFMIVTLIQPLNMLKLKKKAEEDETEKRTDSQREIN